MVGRKTYLTVLLLAPSLVVIGLVVFFPLLYSLYVSLTDITLRSAGATLVGLRNYQALLTDQRFVAAAVRTLGFVACSVTAEMAAGFGLALLMHELGRGRGLFRAAVLVPWAIPTVVSGLTWRWMFNDRMGAVNTILGSVGLLEEPLAWLARPATAWVAIIVAEVWKTAPFVALIILAGLQMVPSELYEAATIDGAGRWRRFRHVTLPLLWPTLFLALLFRTIDALRVFDLVTVMTGGGPAGSTEVLSLYAHKVLFAHLDFGYGSALTFALFLLVMGCSLAYARQAVR
ncbi:MAG: sugar ABC transporter permease [Candidatus Edwardsbacteria bacterium]|jgi:multiple sugar transport system permease protein|nr:sugar ABC transporter permease [Candidatus Edwardsbacteria bacterium]